MSTEQPAINCKTCRFTDQSSAFYRCAICNTTGTVDNEFPRWVRPIMAKTAQQE